MVLEHEKLYETSIKMLRVVAYRLEGHKTLQDWPDFSAPKLLGNVNANADNITNDMSTKRFWEDIFLFDQYSTRHGYFGQYFT